MKRNYLDYVDDIINSIDEIADFIKGINFETFKTDNKTIKAIISNLKQINLGKIKIICFLNYLSCAAGLEIWKLLAKPLPKFPLIFKINIRVFPGNT